MLPCGTPCSCSKVSDNVEPIRTLKDLSDKKFDIKFGKRPLRPISCKSCNRPGYPHPVSSELENSGIRVAVGDGSVTERRRWRLPHQTGKTVHVHAKHYKHNEDGRTRRVCAATVPYRWATRGTSLRELEYTHTKWCYTYNGNIVQSLLFQTGKTQTS